MFHAKKLTNLVFYSDLVMSCNYLEALRIREQVMLVSYERSLLHKAYKHQRRDVTGSRSKFTDLYHTQPLFGEGPPAEHPPPKCHFNAFLSEIGGH